MVEVEPKEVDQSRVQFTEYQSTVYDNQSENAVEEEDNGGPNGRNLEINSTSNIKQKKQTKPLELIEQLKKNSEGKTVKEDLEGLHHDQDEEQKLTDRKKQD